MINRKVKFQNKDLDKFFYDIKLGENILLIIQNKDIKYYDKYLLYIDIISILGFDDQLS